MKREETFTFRISTDERRALERVSEYLQRVDSDTIRFLIRAADTALTNDGRLSTPDDLIRLDIERLFVVS